MREILYRGKAINRCDDREYRTNYKNGDWVYGLISKPYCECFPSLPTEMTNTDGVSGIDVDYTTIGQYTGLTDKNSKKIFEGDIVTLPDEENPCLIEWDKDAARFIADGCDVCVDFDNYYGNELEVIGNVHDNPEYIK